MIETFLHPADKAGVSLMSSKLREHSDTVCETVVGRSILGEEIKAYIIGEGRRRVALFGAHHASESITCNLLFAFLHELAVRIKEMSPYECMLVRHFSYVIVPCVNPDGIEIAMHGADTSPLREREEKMLMESAAPWQANARGVDLNHNYAFGFYEYKKLEEKMGIRAGASLYSGEYPESEPESSACARLVRVLAPIGVLSLHSQGEEILYSRGEHLSRIAERMSRLSGYTPSSPTGTAAYGGLCDYTSSLGIPSFTIEVGKGKNPLPISLTPSLFRRLYPLLLRFPTVL